MTDKKEVRAVAALLVKPKGSGIIHRAHSFHIWRRILGAPGSGKEARGTLGYRTLIFNVTDAAGFAYCAFEVYTFKTNLAGSFSTGTVLFAKPMANSPLP